MELVDNPGDYRSQTDTKWEEPFVAEKKLRLIDIGCSGGLQEKWLPHVSEVIPVLFDANVQEAKKLSDKYPDGIIVECGLSDRDAPQDLVITRNHRCISVLEPNFELLKNYQSRHAFEITGRQRIDCYRYDTLYGAGRVPSPDAIKIDVQGYEYQVLTGFGSLLGECLAIELESHFYPLYVGQKLLHDLTDLLSTFNFVLRRLEPIWHFEGDFIEMNAFYTKRREVVRELDPVQRNKFNLITKVWRLAPY